MTDMKVNLVIRGDGKGGRRAAQEVQAGLRDMGKTAQTTGDRIKRSAGEQAKSIRSSITQSAASMQALKKAGTAAGDAIKRGMAEGVREQRRVGDEADRLGERLKRALRRVGDQGGLFRIMGRTAVSEINRIKSALGSMQGKLAGLGVGFAVGREVGASAQLDRTLLRTRQTAGMTRAQQDELRQEFWTMGRKNGNPLESLSGGFDKLVASGLSYAASKEAIGAIDVGTTITGADSSVLAQGLLTGANAYGFDLAQAGQALTMLEKMIVAGRAGNAELENLADIFARVGPAAQRGGMGFDQSLAMVETLSKLEAAPERLATLAESTTRLFTNRNYMVEAAKSTGVRFFDKDGSRRDMLDVLSEMKSKYDRLSTDKQRMDFVSKAFGKADQDTQKGVQFLLSGNNLGSFRDIQTQIGNASGVVASDLQENRDSPTAVAGRVRNNLRATVDRMSQPINKALAEAGEFLLDDLNLSGGQMIGLAAGTTIAGHYAGRAGGAALGQLGNMVGGGMDTVKNIAVGKTLQDATGVMPVYVTNWAGAPAAGAVMPATGTAGKTAAGGGVLAAARAWGLRLAAPTALAAYPLSRYVGTLDSGMADPTLQADIAGTLRRSRGNGVLASANARNQQTMQRLGVTPEQYQQALASVPSGASLPQREAAMREAIARIKTSAPALSGESVQLHQQAAAQNQAAAQMLDNASRKLDQALSKPIQVQVTADVPWLTADIGQRVERDARRGQ